MERNNEKKKEQLGMHFGTAMGRLRKNIMFSLVQELSKDICYRCNKQIETVEEFSIEHKEDWLDNDIDLFWDLDNISFSHLSCNIGSGKKVKSNPTKIISPKGHSWCFICKEHRPTDEFYKDNSRSSRNGLSSRCKICFNLIRKERYKKLYCDVA